MNQRASLVWMTAAGVIGILFGAFYGAVGLAGLPVYSAFVPSAVFSAWSNGLYGAAFIGFSTLLLLIGRRAFQTNDRVLMRILLYGVNAWLIVEALVSVYYGVYLNVIVDICLSAFLSTPLIAGMWRR